MRPSASADRPTGSGASSPLGLLESVLGGQVPQGPLVTATKTAWRAGWYTLMCELAPQSPEGAYARPKAAPSAPSMRPGAVLHLYAGNACPWCHRVTLALSLRGLLGVAVATTPLTDDAERASRGGWVFDAAAPDPVFGAADLREVYDALSGGRYVGRCTAPLLVDAKSRTLVSNESADIVKLVDGLEGGNSVTLRPPELVGDIERLAADLYTGLNNGVYRAGFATAQAAHASAAADVARTLRELDARLGDSRFLLGDRVTEADVRAFPTVVRHDAVYAALFKCSGARVADLPNLRAWMQDVYLLPGVAATVDVEGYLRSYFGQLFPLNPSGIVPVGPTAEQLGLGEDPGRGTVDTAFHERAAR